MSENQSQDEWLAARLAELLPLPPQFAHGRRIQGRDPGQQSVVRSHAFLAVVRGA
jgi:hypothetical protein